jgi:GT2 family glycosyltransferase
VARRTSEQWAQRVELPDSVDVDVLLPTCNRPAELAVTLAGLAAQAEPSFAVVISDQSAGSPGWEHPAAAAMVRVLEAQGRPVALLRHLPRRGLAEHRQFLLEQSSAEKCLFLDDDVWLEPGALDRLSGALDKLDCGFVGMAPQGLSYLDDRRPEQTAVFEAWEGPVTADLSLQPGQWIPYRVAWLGGCAMYRREALTAAGGFAFWDSLPPDHAGEDVVAQWRVMELYGGAGILPSGAVHLESPTTVTRRDVEARDVVMSQEPAG